MSATTRNALGERTLPHSAGSERAILGAIILDNSQIAAAAALLSPDDFYVIAHVHIFRAMLALGAADVQIDPILLGEHLSREGVLEQIGGIHFLSELTHGLPRANSTDAYAKVVLEKAAHRRLIRILDAGNSAAWDEEDAPSVLIERVRGALAELDEKCARSGSERRTPLITTFAELMSADFRDGEEVAFHARRGEIALVQSVTNLGKSTLARNTALTLATGGEFPPVVKSAPPRRVVLLNYEGSGGWFQSDLRVMSRHFASGELGLLCENLLPTHAPAVGGEPLSLSRHMRLLKSEVTRRGGADVLIIDTASAAFAVRNENDNSEIANGVMKPLLGLARELNCLVILVHHVGKAKAEEGAAREQAHRGRGASAWADFSSSIFNLDADAKDRDQLTLTCAKRKNGPNYEHVLRLDRELRWFDSVGEPAPCLRTNDDLILEAMGKFGRRAIQTAEIESAVAPLVSRRTVADCLNRLLRSGKVAKLKQGWWELPEVCATCAASYVGLHNCANQDVEKKPLGELGLRGEIEQAQSGNGFQGGNGVGH